MKKLGINNSNTHNNVPEKYINVKEYKYYHIFTDNVDMYFADVDEGSKQTAKKKAYELKKEWFAQGIDNIRIYRVEEKEDYRDGNIEQIVEDCIFSIGSFPM